MPDEFLTVREIAERLKLNQQTVRNMIGRGELGAVRVGQRRVRVLQSQLDAFLAGGVTGPRAAAGDPWPAVSDAVRAVSLAVRERDREALAPAIRELQAAAEALPG